MKRIILVFCLSVFSLGFGVKAAEFDSDMPTAAEMKKKIIESEQKTVNENKQITQAQASSDRIILKKDAQGKVIYMQLWRYYDSGRLQSYTYGNVIKYSSYKGTVQRNTTTLEYDEDGHFIQKTIWGSEGNLTFRDTRTYWTNSVMKRRYVYYKTLEGKTKSTRSYDYNMKAKLTKCYLTNGSYKMLHYEVRTYYSNNQLNKRVVAKRLNKNDRRSALYVTKMRRNKTKDVFIRGYYNKKGKNTRNVFFKYNKVGQLKSNKKGNAYKYTTIPKNKIGRKDKYYRARFNKKGKLGKAIRVKGNALNSSFYKYAFF